MAKRRKRKRRKPGTGYTQPDAGGTFKACYPKADGSGYHVRRGYDSRAAAEAWLDSLVQQQDARLDVGGGQQKLSVWIDRWAARAAEERGWKAKTIADVAFKLGYAKGMLGDRLLADMLPDHIDDAVTVLARDLAPTTVRQIRNLLYQVFDEAVQRRYIAHNPVLKPKRARKPQTREPYRLSRIEAARLLDAAHALKRRETLAWRLILVLGLREGEVLGLQRHDLDLMRLTVTIRQQYTMLNGRAHKDTPKSAAGARTLPIPASFRPLVGAHLAALDERARLARRRGTWEDHQLLFPGKSGRPMNPSSFLHILQRDLLPAAQLPRITVHMLRHTASAFYAHVGAPELLMNAILGHAPSNVTQHYARPDLATLRVWVERVDALISGAGPGLPAVVEG